MSDAEKLADAILQASGSKLRNYSMPVTRSAILGAAQSGIDDAMERAAALIDEKCAEVLSKQDGRSESVDANLRLVAVLLPDLASGIRAMKGGAQ